MIEEQNINQLPKDWKWVKLGEYVEPVKGKKPKRFSVEKTEECSIPYINIKAFEKNIIDEYTDGVGCVLCNDGDFLMVWDGSRSGYVGKAIKGALGSTLVKLNFPDIENNYAYYFLQSKFLDINTRAKGVGIPHVDQNILWNYDLLIPPKTTQQAIVSKIEELFSELDKGIEQLKTAQQQLKTYRQSVLKWAFEGKLTDEDVSEDELPKEWKWVRISEIAKIETGTTPSKSNANFYGNEFPFYKPTDLEAGANVVKSTDGLTKLGVDAARYIPENSTLVTCIGATIGKTGFIKTGGGFNQQINAIVPNEKMNPKFVYYQTIGLHFQKQILDKASATTLPIINKGKFQMLEMVVCSIEEQNNIVQEIESRLSVADKMEESITESLQQAEALRQSILKKAFEGRLI
jgi:type I restriction enzyme S subunit